MKHNSLVRAMRFKACVWLATLAVPFCSPGRLAAQFCSSETTVGQYLVVCDGYLTPAPNAPLVPAKLMATSTSDFGGNIKATGTVSIGGQIVTQVVTGTEKVNPDCTGTVSYTQTINGQPGPPLDVTFYISGGGDRIDGLSTDPGTVFACVLTRISRISAAAVLPGPAQVTPSSTGRREKPIEAYASVEQQPLTASLRTRPGQH